MKNEEKKYEHPSFGMLSLSRIHGKSGYLFGSEIQSDNFIELTLSEGEMNRELSNDWFFARKPLFKVKMSANQFSELITTLNVGSGVPVTIEEVLGERIEQCTDMESKKTYTHNQFRQRMAELMVDINKRWKQAEKIIDKKTLTKDDQRELKLFYDKLTTEVKSNIPFFVKCFQEVMDKVVLDAKTEIDSALLRVVVDAGIKALGIDGNNEGTKYISQD